ncbi:hypothetical protein IAR55_004541 [Kwoniella newhampshirensis]|uniref:Zn(2)-C6 fungal-type domain-containing protein n=1 Tax=Kwoniella newhampshirensis TaxID=1651941 RepID=A0AAW0YK04_9TREE
MPTTDPQESQQPLKQRKLNRSLPQLKRNAACLPCRRRRIKCDAGKPHCSSCVRSYHFLARKHPDEERDAKGVQCFYDDDGVVGDDDEMVEDDHDFPSVPKRGAKRKDNEQEDSQQVIQRLEMKIAELQRALETSTESSAPPSYQGPTGSGSDLSEPATASNLWPTSQNPEDIVNQVFVSATGFAADITSNPIGLDMASGPGGHTLGPSVEDGIDDEAGKMGGPFLDLLWPGWPPTLPTPAMVDHLWIDGWMLIGAATRLVICLGLLDERAQSDPDISSYRRSVLGPPKDDADREARAATLYYVLCYDITSASSSGWSGTMPVDEIFTKLPGSRIDFDQGIDGDIAAFGLSFPAALRDPVQYRQGYSKGIDADLIVGERDIEIC